MSNSEVMYAVAIHIIALVAGLGLLAMNINIG